MALTTKEIMERMNPKGKPAKGRKIKRLKGGTGMSAAGKKRGGYGAARANLGFAAAKSPIKPVIGRSK